MYVNLKAGETGTEMISACQAFTGPSLLDIADSDAGLEFRKCTEPDQTGSGDGTSCRLQAYLWSSTSRNAVPVAEMHSVGFSDFSMRQTHAAMDYEDISKDVLDAVASATASWSQDWLTLSLFTAEGDLFHQPLACVFLGPDGRADISPREVEG